MCSRGCCFNFFCCEDCCASEDESSNKDNEKSFLSSTSSISSDSEDSDVSLESNETFDEHNEEGFLSSNSSDSECSDVSLGSNQPFDKDNEKSFLSSTSSTSSTSSNSEGCAVSSGNELSDSEERIICELIISNGMSIQELFQQSKTELKQAKEARMCRREQVETEGEPALLKKKSTTELSVNTRKPVSSSGSQLLGADVKTVTMRAPRRMRSSAKKRKKIKAKILK